MFFAVHVTHDNKKAVYGMNFDKAGIKQTDGCVIPQNLKFHIYDNFATHRNGLGSFFCDAVTRSKLVKLPVQYDDVILTKETPLSIPMI